VRAEHCLVLSLVLQDYRIPVCAQLLVMIVIAVENWHEGFISTTVTTAADVWTRRVIVWIVFGSMEVEAMSCKDEW